MVATEFAALCPIDLYDFDGSLARNLRVREPLGVELPQLNCFGQRSLATSCVAVQLQVHASATGRKWRSVGDKNDVLKVFVFIP